MTEVALDGDPRSIADAVHRAAEFLEAVAYRGRVVRVAFSEKRFRDELGPRLEPAYIAPAGATGNAHNYPWSIAGWALAEGRVIQWPQEADVPCDFGRIDELGKTTSLDSLIDDDKFLNAPPYLARTIDVEALRTAYRAKALVLGDFYQDWVAWSPARRYREFISVPVPLDPDTSALPAREYGVFNIDSFEDVTLLGDGTVDHLRTAASFVAAAYRNTS